jgi:dihydrofolate synthase/folylpolyglutamate synthase
MNFQQCLNYLEEVQKLGVKFGLDNVRTVLESLHSPHLSYPSILVAGTNGKGSVCAVLTRILSLHGFRVGLFTSPHLVSVRERIRIGDTLIPKKDFSLRLTFLKDKIEALIETKILNHHPTYFELLTCLAFLSFKREKVDIAVLEVGMGGRFDATNIVMPLLSVICTISLEHQKTLGETSGQIAFEKSGIMRSGVPVVCGAEDLESLAVLQKRAEELGAPFSQVFEKKGSFQVCRSGKQSGFLLRTSKGETSFSPSLLGTHQGKNAAIAIVAAEHISSIWKNLEKERIIQGVETTRWEGRLEPFSENPLVLLDGAHNEEGAQALKTYIQDSVSTPVILVFALMRDKKVEKIADLLFPLSERVILTRFPYFRAASPEEIQEKTRMYQDKVVLEPDVFKAVTRAVSEAKEQKTVVIAGSLFLVGEVKKLFPDGV